ncbi:MAG: hypothetical protein HQL07_04350 [Nitrospirae bacterium]|nr:hypothetical protein [Magnetococcales bacterium]HAT51445.1 hypothetical protein [Alphaproteobacteria bacterium]
MFMVIAEAALRQGLLLIPIAVGVYLSFRILRFADLTPDGSILIGGSACVVLLQSGCTPWCALFGGAVAGAATGCVTGLLSEYGGVDRVLAGLGTSMAAYTVALRVLGRGNVAITDSTDTIYSYLVNDIVISCVICIFVLTIVTLLLKTRLGLVLRAVGENSGLVSQLGGVPAFYRFAGLAFANALVGFGGGMLAQNQGFFDINQGVGTLFIGLAGVLIGMSLPFKDRPCFGPLVTALGTLIFALLTALALRMGVFPGDIKFLTATLVIGAAWFARLSSRGRDAIPLIG